MLERYLRRIGVEARPDHLHAMGQDAEGLVALLDLVLGAHAEAITFENLDVLTGTGVRVDEASVVAKLIDGGRGGYCHEHARLVLTALRELDLRARAVLCRILVGPGRTAPGPQTHQVVLVEVQGRTFLADPGFGGGTPCAGVEVADDGPERELPHGTFRVRSAEQVPEALRAEANWVLQVRTDPGAGFRDVYAFGGDAAQEADLVVSNWYTSTCPGTRFTGAPVLARTWRDGRKSTLDGALLRRVRYGASPQREERRVADASEYLSLLREEFGLRLTAHDAAALTPVIEKALAADA